MNLLRRWFNKAWRHESRLSRHLGDQARMLMRRGKKALAFHERARLDAALTAVKEARALGHTDTLRKANSQLEALMHETLSTFVRPAWLESLQSMASAVLVALVLRAFVVEAFKIPSGSMIPSLRVGDQIFVNKYIYGPRIPFTHVRPLHFAAPKRGEVIVFICPKAPNEDYIKRIIAVGGDTIQVVRGVVWVNGQKSQHRAIEQQSFDDKDMTGTKWRSFVADTYQEKADAHAFVALYDTDPMHTAPDFGPEVVKAGHVFVMGDNRDHSYDSRAWGPVPIDNILGRAMFVWWSWGPDGARMQRLGTWIR